MYFAKERGEQNAGTHVNRSPSKPLTQAPPCQTLQYLADTPSFHTTTRGQVLALAPCHRGGN